MRLSEQDLIARYFAPLAGPGGLGLRDDVALLAPPPGMELALTADALVAGVHFFAEDPPEKIAAKALAVNLSDLAAKAADPLGFLLTLALPRNWSEDWLESFARGLGEMARERRCPLLGGDTVATPGPLTLSITALGAVPAGRMPRRTSAREGDALYVSGTIGDAALGLALREAEVAEKPAPDWAERLTPAQRADLIDRYLLPQTPPGAGARLARMRQRRHGRFRWARWRFARHDAGERRHGAGRLAQDPAVAGVRRCGCGRTGPVRADPVRRRRL